MQSDTALREVATWLVTRGDHQPLLLMAKLSHDLGFSELATTLVEHAQECADALMQGVIFPNSDDAYLNQVASLFGQRSWQAAA